MTGYTPIYNLPYPQASDLVSAYPGTGQDLAEEVETVLTAKASLSGATYTGTHDFTGATVTGIPLGLAHIVTSTFTTSGSVIVNNCFTSTYANYRIEVVLTASSVTGLRIRLRASGTDSSASYNVKDMYLSGGTTFLSAYTASGSEANLGSVDTQRSFTAFDIASPQIAEYTNIAGQASADTFLHSYAATHKVASAYDGFNLLPSSGGVTFSGVLRVYGYKNS